MIESISSSSSVAHCLHSPTGAALADSSLSSTSRTNSLSNTVPHASDCPVDGMMGPSLSAFLAPFPSVLRMPYMPIDALALRAHGACESPFVIYVSRPHYLGLRFRRRLRLWLGPRTAEPFLKGSCLRYLAIFSAVSGLSRSFPSIPLHPQQTRPLTSPFLWLWSTWSAFPVGLRPQMAHPPSWLSRRPLYSSRVIP